MEYRQFQVPADVEILNVLGIEPEPVEDDGFTRVIRLSTESGDLLVFSYDVPGCSVRCRWYRESRLLLDLFREGAIRLSVSSHSGELGILVYFETGSLSGELSIRLGHYVAISDRLLFS